MKRIVVLVLIQLLMAGCASIVSVSETSIPAQRDHVISAQASKVIVLGLNFDNDFVDQLVNDLKTKCPSHSVQGVLTKDEVIDYFIMLVYKRKVTVTGYCMDHRVASLAKGMKTL